MQALEGLEKLGPVGGVEAGAVIPDNVDPLPEDIVGAFGANPRLELFCGDAWVSYFSATPGGVFFSGHRKNAAR